MEASKVLLIVCLLCLSYFEPDFLVFFVFFLPPKTAGKHREFHFLASPGEMHLIKGQSTDDLGALCHIERRKRQRPVCKSQQHLSVFVPSFTPPLLLTHAIPCTPYPMPSRFSQCPRRTCSLLTTVVSVTYTLVMKSHVTCCCEGVSHSLPHLM